MTINKPVFCGQEPSFMGGAFDNEKTHDKNTTQAQALTVDPVNKNKDFFPCYFHGKLEDMMGFDIVSLVDGVLPKIKFGDKIKCIAITPDNKKHDAIMYVGERKWWWTEEQLYCLIMLKTEKMDITEMEFGTVTFNEEK